MDDAIKELKKGNDTDIRHLYTNYIKEVFRKSEDGELGWGDFVGEIRHLINEMEETCKEN